MQKCWQILAAHSNEIIAAIIFGATLCFAYALIPPTAHGAPISRAA